MKERTLRMSSQGAELQDRIKLRSKLLVEEGMSNLSDRGGVITGDIIGKSPNKNNKGFKPSELMMRATLRSGNENLNYEVLLRNSFITFSFTRPNRLEMGGLINDIEETVKGYVRSVNNNFPSIARVAAQKAIWNFISKRIVKCSVSDIQDFAQLSTLIRVNDFDTIVAALLASFTNKGVNMTLRCLNPKCSTHETKLVDPTKLVRHRAHTQTDEEAAIFANLLNSKITLTAKETLELQNKTNYKLDSTKVYNEAKDIYLDVRAPLLSHSFNSFDYFISSINSKVADIRQKVLDAEEYETQLQILYNSLGSIEFLHWVNSFNIIHDLNDPSEVTTLTRENEEEANDFDKGLYESLLADGYLNKELSKFILNKAAYMSHTFVGLRNSVCNSCKKDNKEFTELGYTPVCMVTSFFYCLRLQILLEAERLAAANLEAQQS